MACKVAILLSAFFTGESDARRVATSKNEVPVEILFVRQGHSCGNALHAQGEKKGMTGVVSGKVADAKTLNHAVKFLDAPLTNCGKHQSQLTGKQLRDALKKQNWKWDAVLSSTLLRAMETGTYMFPGETVYPVPFLAEHGFGPSKGPLNRPRNLKEQKFIFKNDPVEFQFVPNATLNFQDPRLHTIEAKATIHKGGGFQAHKYSPKAARMSSTYRAFRAFAGENLLPKLLSRRQGSGPLRLVVLGHGNFFKKTLAKYFDCQTPFINNDAMLVKLNYNIEKTKLTETYGCEKPLKDGPWVNWDRPFLCPKDYQMCYAHGSSKFMGGNDEGKGSEYVNTRPDDNSDGCCIDAKAR